jgi:hypothetical protein
VISVYRVNENEWKRCSFIQINYLKLNRLIGRLRRASRRLPSGRRQKILNKAKTSNETPYVKMLTTRRRTSRRISFHIRNKVPSQAKSLDSTPGVYTAIIRRRTSGRHSRRCQINAERRYACLHTTYWIKRRVVLFFSTWTFPRRFPHQNSASVPCLSHPIKMYFTIVTVLRNAYSRKQKQKNCRCIPWTSTRPGNFSRVRTVWKLVAPRSGSEMFV